KRRLALVHGNLKWQSERSLLSDYKCALDECGLEYDPQFVISHTQTTRDIDIRSEFLLEKLLLLKNVDAVFIDDAPNALTLQGRLQSRGYKIPEDIIITGGDNDPFFSYLTPKIPTLRPQYHLIAKTLLNKLLEPNRNVQPVVIESEYVIEAQNQFFLP
ncbi:MAG: LacI family transcriptional regulator, partial [Candidatus Gastranaerophilales bacterium]|nr:LacI family transcriptional regulator [Candidatus Gastranaerophilales bacterium]